jgi:hypothetical protein
MLDDGTGMWHFRSHGEEASMWRDDALGGLLENHSRRRCDWRESAHAHVSAA